MLPGRCASKHPGYRVRVVERQQRGVVPHDVRQPVLAGHGADGGEDADHVVLAHLHRDVLAHRHLVTRAARVEQISGAEQQNDDAG